MNFAEATKLLKEGAAIRRKAWQDYIHIKIDTITVDDKPQKIIKGYRQETVPFNYNMDIILSDDWVAIGEEDVLLDFPSAVEKLNLKYKVRLKEWNKSTFLYLGSNRYDIYMCRLCEYHYMSSFEDFGAMDWEVFE